MKSAHTIIAAWKLLCVLHARKRAGPVFSYVSRSIKIVSKKHRKEAAEVQEFSTMQFKSKTAVIPRSWRKVLATIRQKA